MTKHPSLTLINYTLRRKYRKHFEKFWRMHDNNKDIVDIPYTDEGFKTFVNILGLIPTSMNNPSLGRKNHDLPYSTTNIAWQEWECNKAESAFRNDWLYQTPYRTWSDLSAALKSGIKIDSLHPLIKRRALHEPEAKS
jgi:hypothetical protein